MINLKVLLVLYFFSLVSLGTIAYASDQLPDIVNPNVPSMPSVQALRETPVLPDVKMHQRTHTEKIVFAQMKLGGKQPDLDAFAKASPFVLNAQEIDKSAMIFSEYNRIGNNFNLYDKNTTIIVHTNAKIDEYSSLQNLLVFDEFDETSFFKFNFYDYNVGIVPQDMLRFRRLQLSKPSAERLFSQLNGQEDIVVEFLLLPFFADVETPLNQEGQDYWLMAAQIAEFRLWSSDDPEDAKLLWFYRSPNYSPIDNQDINSLYLESVTQ